MIALLAWLAFARSSLRPALCRNMSLSRMLPNFSAPLPSPSASEVADAMSNDSGSASIATDKKKSEPSSAIDQPLPPRTLSKAGASGQSVRDPMIIRTMFTAVGAILTASAGYAALTVAAPDVAGKIESVARDFALGWSADACQSNPTGCLSNRFEHLSTLEREFEASTNAIHSEIDRVTRLVSDQEELVGKNAMFLDQGRSLYRERIGQSGQPGAADGPITFAGRSYPNTATFKSQLQLLFEEKVALEASLSSAKELRNQLQARLEAIMVQSGQITLAKRMIPAQLELVRANKTLGEFSMNVTLIDGIIRGSEAGLDQSRQLIRTTQDLMAPSTNDGRSSASQEAFDSFLKN